MRVTGFFLLALFGAILLRQDICGQDAAVNEPDSVFRITSYKPTHFSQWRWWVTGRANASSSRSADQDATYGHETVDDARRIDGRFATSLLHPYYDSSRFGYLLAQLEPTVRYYSDSAIYIGQAEQYYSEWLDGGHWDYGSYAALDGEHAHYISRKFYIGLDGHIAGYWLQTPLYAVSHLDTTLLVDSADGGHWWSASRTENSSVSRRWDVNLRPKLGIGRVYEGGFASTAHDMVAVLRDAGLLERELSNGEYRALTDTVYHYRRTVPFDSREHRIAALAAIGAYLTSIGAIEADPVRAALLLEDVWDYFPNGGTTYIRGASLADLVTFAPQLGRPFGWRADLGVSLTWNRRANESSRYTASSRVGYDYLTDSLGHRDSTAIEQQIDETTTGRHIDQVNRASIFAALQWYRPLSYRWQFSFSGQTDAYLHNTSKTEYRDIAVGTTETVNWYQFVTTYCNYFTANATLELTYFFDSRSQIRMSISSSVAHYRATDRRTKLSGGSLEVARGSFGTSEYSAWGRLGYDWRVAVPTTVSLSFTASRDRREPTRSAWSERSSVTFGATVLHYLR